MIRLSDIPVNEEVGAQRPHGAAATMTVEVVDGAPVFWLAGEDGLRLASCSNAQRLSQWAFAHGADAVHWRFDVRVAEEAA